MAQRRDLSFIPGLQVMEGKNPTLATRPLISTRMPWACVCMYAHVPLRQQFHNTPRYVKRSFKTPAISRMTATPQTGCSSYVIKIPRNVQNKTKPARVFCKKKKKGLEKMSHGKSKASASVKNRTWNITSTLNKIVN